ncbi:MAG TPA: alpha/beta fold hydrolase [Gemmatimonadales bacterium]|jgi:pimeloyl-ACP methyl ester carboxylesterase|nr:alpha/beta fold hydrolase [Gemmatimonadales bacterium]
MTPGLAAIGMSVRASDGLVLKGELRYPDRSPGAQWPLAVLAHQYPADRHSFQPLIADLLDLGVATLAFDERGHGESIIGPDGPVVADTPSDFSPSAFGDAFMASAGEVAFFRIADDIIRAAAWGAAQNFISESLVLVGASVGGTGVLLAAQRAPRLRGVVTLGAAGALAHGADAADRIRAALESGAWPALLTASERDPFDAAQSIRDWSAGLPHVMSRITPGAGHAMAIYYDVRDDVREFVKHCLA